ncbi:lmo0937 family membrane protein [Planococcus sp. YIM B11945]|uniref:lmo0937 family membrane protein n=1 Tax=Planococcus sp. YIM B11945 TaxID=3435410 RepID=UPI003D7DBC23
MGRILWIILVIILAFWLIGFVMDIAGGLIHILLVIAVIIFIVNLISGRRGV